MTPLRRATNLLQHVLDNEHRERLRELFDERAAICEFDGGLTREQAEAVALFELRLTLGDVFDPA